MRNKALGAAGTLAAYSAYKLYKRHTDKKKNESVEDFLNEILYIAEDHYDLELTAVELFNLLAEAADDYEDIGLFDDLSALVEEDEEREDSMRNLKGAAMNYGAQTLGGLAVTAAWNKLASKRFRKKALGAVGRAHPAVKGVAMAAGAIGATELARRALARRKARLDKEGKRKKR